MIPCKKCGLCCLSCLCSAGKEGKNGFCKYLFKTRQVTKVTDTDFSTGCKLIKSGKLTSILGSGCVIRSNETLYHLYVETYVRNIKIFFEIKKDEYEYNRNNL